MIRSTQRKAKKEFQFSSAMMTYVDKTIRIQYDDKEFTGRVDDIYYDGPHNSGLIMENKEGVWKHIKLYRLQKLQIIQ
ncbi:MAG TPA: hypothetical protein GXZ90_05055 [Clostridiales bacterium]|nr:hypothetical protein [Clostridiales bacterium]